jgi:hypothetical protein
MKVELKLRFPGMFRIGGGGNIRRIKRRPRHWEQLELRDDYRFIPENREWDPEECELISRAIGLYDISPDASYGAEKWLKRRAIEFCRTGRLILTADPC